MKAKISNKNICLLSIVLIIGVIYFLKGGVLLKGLTSFSFLLLGLVSFISVKKKSLDNYFSLFVLLGLTVCFLADIVLNFDFIIGAIFFAVGHIFYFSSYCTLRKFNRIDFLISIILASSSLIFLVTSDSFDFGGQILKYACFFYAFIISFMLGKAFVNYFLLKNKTSLLLFLGSLLFFASDVALLFYVFGGASEFANTICFITYFPAQCIIALSIESVENKHN